MRETSRGVCNLCGGQGRQIWHEGGLRVLKCGDCGLRFLDQPPEMPIDEVYSPHYFREYYEHSASIRRERFAELLDGVQPHVDTGRVLDVGCGIGLFIEVARARGWTVVGIEPSSYARQSCREHGMDVVGALADLPPGESFDLVTFWDVLCSVPDPRAYLEAAARLVRPGGLVVAKVPHRPDAAFRLAGFLSLVTRSRGLLHVPAQAYHFTGGSLRAALESVGLEVQAIEALHEVSQSKPGLKHRLYSGYRWAWRALGVPESLVVRARRVQASPRGTRQGGSEREQTDDPRLSQHQ